MTDVEPIDIIVKRLDASLHHRIAPAFDDEHINKVVQMPDVLLLPNIRCRNENVMFMLN